MTRLLHLLLAACVLWLGIGSGSAGADVFQPAFLQLRQTGAETYDVLWRVPARGDDLRLALHARFPDGAVNLGEARSSFGSGSHVERWTLRHPGGLAGQTIRVDGLAGSAVDVLVRVERSDGSAQVARLVPARPQFVVETTPGPLEVARTYTVLGVEHILIGFDHLLFVLALLFLVRGGRRLVWTITSFTLAHSLTLAAATLGFVNVPGPPVEATIALSIVFLAREMVTTARGQQSFTERAPWIVAFTFGLLHGLGFAGVLAEIGLPQNAIPLALLCFNLGVELGQLLFVAAALAAFHALRRWDPRPLTVWRALPAYAIGSIAAYWLVARVAAF